jgi:hypothetical protein
MRGIIYRLGVRVKEFGEQRRVIVLILLGLWIRDRV